MITTPLFCNKVFSEHHSFYYRDFNVPPEEYESGFIPIGFRGQNDAICFEVTTARKINNSYFIGVDWITKEKAVLVHPKVNAITNEKVDYIQMFISALTHPDVLDHADKLYEVKFDQPLIKIKQQNDFLTPLLVIQFLRLVQEIVKKGLKKSYYVVERNLHAKVKGRILVSESLKYNISRNKNLNTICRYEEFGVNTPENRLLKKTLTFIKRWTATVKMKDVESYFASLSCFIDPAFMEVKEDLTSDALKHQKFNVFFKEYDQALTLAKVIIKRFGYNISNTQSVSVVETPPFWIDMSKLFELYVLGKLKDRFKANVTYHFKKKWNELDYLLNTEKYKLVIDAKYKLRYRYGYDIEDIRQISGYARLTEVYEELDMDISKVINCLVIYPDQKASEELPIELLEMPINNFVGFFKVPIRLPVSRFVPFNG